MKKTTISNLVSATIPLLAIGILPITNAQLTFTMTEVVGGVSVTGSGNMPFSTPVSPSGAPGGSAMSSGGGYLQIGPYVAYPPGSGQLSIITSGPLNFGTTMGLVGATSASGPDTFGFDALGGSGDVFVPIGYTSGSPLSGSAFWSGYTLASLGATPGTYVWNTLDNGVASTITLTVVPEPHEYAVMAGLGLLAFAGYRRWRSRA